MKIIRSAKCSLKFSTQKKKNELQTVLNEYSKVVNVFIEYFWLNPDKASKGELLKPNVLKNASQYNDINVWKENENVIYLFAKKMGWLDECNICISNNKK
jgi:hypothetical protein